MQKAAPPGGGGGGGAGQAAVTRLINTPNETPWGDHPPLRSSAKCIPEADVRLGVGGQEGKLFQSTKAMRGGTGAGPVLTTCPPGLWANPSGSIQRTTVTTPHLVASRGHKRDLMAEEKAG